VDRANRSSRVTTNTSPFASSAISELALLADQGEFLDIGHANAYYPANGYIDPRAGDASHINLFLAHDAIC